MNSFLPFLFNGDFLSSVWGASAHLPRGGDGSHGGSLAEPTLWDCFLKADSGHRYQLCQFGGSSS